MRTFPRAGGFFWALAAAGLLASCTGTILEEQGAAPSDGGVSPGRDSSSPLFPFADAAGIAGEDAGAPAGADAATSLPDAATAGPDAATAGPDAATDPCATVRCSANSRCEQGACVCNPGFVLNASGGCVAPNPGDPATRTTATVCAAWKAGHVLTDNNPFTPSATPCDPGTFSQAGIDDTITRINLWRWMVGLGPVSGDTASHAAAQRCAVITANNPAGQQAHHPPSTANCYTPDGAATAGRSNLAWGAGSSPASIDLYVDDWGNAQTLGHRRWVLYPQLGAVGVGFYVGGNNYGNAQCLSVFGGGGPGPTGPFPDWYAYPPPGYSPTAASRSTWSFHGAKFDATNATASVVRLSDKATLPVTMQVLYQGYGDSAASWNPSGWTPTAGETYRVTVSGLSGTTPAITYDVKPVDCPP